MPIPIGYLTDAAVYAAVGAVLAVPLLKANVRLAPRLGLIDWPKARGVTEEQIPIVGHALVLITLVATAIVMQFHPISPWFLTTAIVMGIMGHLDDRKPLPALDKFFFQMVCAATVVFLDPHIHHAMTAKYGMWGSAGAVFFLLGLMNAVNFIDGIDGLAGIILIVGSLGFLLLSHGQPELHAYVVLSAIIAGALVPFLQVNVLKRRGFLGNVGSYFFSYVLGMMHLAIPIESANVLARLSLSGLCFLIPIADAAMVITMRLATGRSPFAPDKGHLHHRLVQTSLNLRYILLIFAMLEVSALVVGFIMAENAAIRNSWLPAFVCLSHVTSTAILIVLVEKASRRRVQTYFERLNGGGTVACLRYRLRQADGSPVPFRKLQRLEARISSEIRISDLCYVESPESLFITLKTMQEPMRAIVNRIEAIIESERLRVQGEPEVGEYRRVDRPAEPTLLRRAQV